VPAAHVALLPPLFPELDFWVPAGDGVLVPLTADALAGDSHQSWAWTRRRQVALRRLPRAARRRRLDLPPRPAADPPAVPRDHPAYRRRDPVPGYRGRAAVHGQAHAGQGRGGLHRCAAVAVPGGTRLAGRDARPGPPRSSVACPAAVVVSPTGLACCSPQEARQIAHRSRHGKTPAAPETEASRHTAVRDRAIKRQRPRSGR